MSVAPCVTRPMKREHFISGTRATPPNVIQQEN